MSEQAELEDFARILDVSMQTLARLPGFATSRKLSKFMVLLAGIGVDVDEMIERRDRRAALSPPEPKP